MTNDQFIVVTTNSVPAPLPVVTTNNFAVLEPATWYLAACSVETTNTNSYTILATWVTATNVPAFTIIPLSDGVPTNGTATPGYPTNLLYSFTVTNSPAGVQFTVINTSGAGNVELLANFDIFPTPGQFLSGSFNPGTDPQIVVIGTNATTLQSLNGTWYLAVPNTSATNVTYTIEASTITNGSVTNVPLFLRAGVSLQTGGFSMSWRAISGRTYEVEVSTNLTTWTFLTNIVAQSNTASYTDLAPVAGQKARFYRLMLASDAPLHLGGNITSPANGFTLYWRANTGQTYEIDTSTNLLTWTFVTNVTTLTTSGSYTDPTPVAGQIARYYRVRQ